VLVVMRDVVVGVVVHLRRVRVDGLAAAVVVNALLVRGVVLHAGMLLL
jgi:hypothetical protein